MSYQKPSSTNKDKKKQPSKSSKVTRPKTKPAPSKDPAQPLLPELVDDIYKDKSALDILMERLACRQHNGGIDLSLLARRCLNTTTNDIPAEELVTKLNEITHIRLDRESISRIDNLELFGSKMKNLYLQHNSISQIEGLDTLSNLRFLTLSHNSITRIENLSHLKRLGLLDLSFNKIDQLDADELPLSLSFLNLEGNDCQNQAGYRSAILARCLQLCQLDGSRLTAEERRAAGHDATSESEDSDQEEATPTAENPQLFDAEILGVFDDLSTDIFMRCQSRIQQLLAEHKGKMTDLETIKTTCGVSIEDRASTSASRLSSRLDSPDTTDSSRPPTGNV